MKILARCAQHLGRRAYAATQVHISMVFEFSHSWSSEMLHPSGFTADLGVGDLSPSPGFLCYKLYYMPSHCMGHVQKIYCSGCYLPGLLETSWSTTAWHVSFILAICYLHGTYYSDSRLNATGNTSKIEMARICSKNQSLFSSFTYWHIVRYIILTDSGNCCECCVQGRTQLKC